MAPGACACVDTCPDVASTLTVNSPVIAAVRRLEVIGRVYSRIGAGS